MKIRKTKITSEAAKQKTGNALLAELAEMLEHSTFYQYVATCHRKCLDLIEKELTV